jgi:hypothetical protein
MWLVIKHFIVTHIVAFDGGFINYYSFKNTTACLVLSLSFCGVPGLVRISLILCT